MREVNGGEPAPTRTRKGSDSSKAYIAPPAAVQVKAEREPVVVSVPVASPVAVSKKAKVKPPPEPSPIIVGANVEPPPGPPDIIVLPK